MGPEEIKKTVSQLINEIGADVGADESKITDDAHFIKDIGLDSMALLEVLATLEKKFGVSIPETEFPNLITINKCTDTVQKYLAAKK
jgi:acyl carrier protein